MGLYYRSELQIRIAEDSAAQDVLFQRTKDVVTDEAAFLEYNGNRLKVADTDGEVALDLGGVETGAVLFVETDAALNVKLDGSLVQLRPGASQKAKLLVELGSFAALTVQCPTVGATATVTYALAGA